MVQPSKITFVVVGMRYAQDSIVRKANNKFLNIGGRVAFIPVPIKLVQVKVTGSEALSVRFEGEHVGYIRETDLAQAKRIHHNYDFSISGIRDNYWLVTGTLKDNSSLPQETMLTNKALFDKDKLDYCTRDISAGVTRARETMQTNKVLFDKDMLDYYSMDTSTGTTSHREDSMVYAMSVQDRAYRDILNQLNSTTVKPKEDTKMAAINTKSMRDSFFREVNNVTLEIQSGKFGIVTPEGIAVYDNGTINVNPITEMGVPVPAFAVRVAVEDLVAGDIIVSGSGQTFFKATTDTGYEVVTSAGETKQIGNVANLFFGKNTVLAVKNMFSGSGMDPMMMALMMGNTSNGGGMDMKTFAMMSMLGGGKGKKNKGGMDPMMLLLLLGGNK